LQSPKASKAKLLRKFSVSKVSYYLMLRTKTNKVHFSGKGEPLHSPKATKSGAFGEFQGIFTLFLAKVRKVSY
jgi:hypothetical protein